MHPDLELEVTFVQPKQETDTTHVSTWLRL